MRAVEVIMSVERCAHEEPPAVVKQSSPPKSERRKLPAHLPSRDVVHEPSCACPACGGEMRKVGEDVTEILDCITRLRRLCSC
jgi:hypothetical protein